MPKNLNGAPTGRRFLFGGRETCSCTFPVSPLASSRCSSLSNTKLAEDFPKDFFYIRFSHDLAHRP